MSEHTTTHPSAGHSGGRKQDRVLPRRWLILGAALVLALAGLTGVAAFMAFTSERSESTGVAAIGGPFRLTDQHGQRVTNQTFAGKYMLVYFGYTYCPDICPFSLQNMVAALDQLPPKQAEQIVPVFITVDPERDTVEQLASYAPLFGERLVALTGTDAEIKAAARAYRVYFARADVEGDDNYLMDHSSFIYLMGPDGTYQAHFGHSTSPHEMAAKLESELTS